MSRFCRFSQSEFEEFLGVGSDGKPLPGSNWHRIRVPGTIEAVYGRRIHPELSLRIYSTLERGFARDLGSDAIRICVAWRPQEREQAMWIAKGLTRVDPRYPDRPAFPMIVGGETRVHRVDGWRNNLTKRLEAYEELIPPPCPHCGCPTVWRTPAKGQTWQPFWGCVWSRGCPGKNDGPDRVR